VERAAIRRLNASINLPGICGVIAVYWRCCNFDRDRANPFELARCVDRPKCAADVRTDSERVSRRDRTPPTYARDRNGDANKAQQCKLYGRHHINPGDDYYTLTSGSVPNSVAQTFQMRYGRNDTGAPVCAFVSHN
jgi:hypothetical protein